MLMMKAGVFRPRRLVSLRKIEKRFSAIEAGPAGELRVGAMTPLGALERSVAVRGGWPVIARTLRTLSNVRVRNVATVGGHLAHADPHMDLPPVLAALGARVSIAGPAGERTIAVEELSKGYLETVLRGDELIATLTVPPLGGRSAAYLKCTTRSADDWPALGVAVALGDGGARIFISAATDRPTRLTAAEKILDAKKAGEAAAEEVDLESDSRGSAGYKKQLIRVYVARAIHEARNQAR